jgi:hypothetical protein
VNYKEGQQFVETVAAQEVTIPIARVLSNLFYVNWQPVSTQALDKERLKRLFRPHGLDTDIAAPLRFEGGRSWSRAVVLCIKAHRSIARVRLIRTLHLQLSQHTFHSSQSEA